MTYADAFNIRTKNVKFNDVADAIDGVITRSYGGTTTGTSTAYISSPSPSWTAYDAAAAIIIIPHITNTAGSPSVTINVSGLGAKAMKTGGNDLPAGVLVVGKPTVLVYTGAHFEVTIAQNSLLTDGTNLMLADLNFGGFRPSNVASGTALLPAYCAGGDVDTGVFSPGANEIGIATGGAERLRIGSTGLVGIGTTNPGELLHLRSSAPRIRFEDTDGGGALATISANSTSGNLVLQADIGNAAANTIIGFDVDGATRVQMNQYGLGVNVTPFVNTLSLGIDMEDNAGMFGHNNNLYLQANSYFNGTWLRKSAGFASLYVVEGAVAQHRWYIAANGAAGSAISWFNPMNLDGSGRLTVNAITSSAGTIVGGAGISYPDSATYMGIAANAIGMGWDFPHIYASVDNVVNTIIGTVSDYRLKENFSPLNSALSKLLSLEVGTYNPKSFEGDVSEKVHCGVLAHVAGELFPDLVVGEKDRVSENGNPLYQSFNYAGLVPYLVVALKEQQEQIRQLQEIQ